MGEKSALLSWRLQSNVVKCNGAILLSIFCGPFQDRTTEKSILYTAGGIVPRKCRNCLFVFPANLQSSFLPANVLTNRRRFDKPV